MNLNLETFNRKEVLQYLRWTGSEIPPEVDALIDDCMAETLRVSEPRFIYRILPIDWEAHTCLLYTSYNREAVWYDEAVRRCMLWQPENN